MKDVQNQTDKRNKHIQKVGIRKLILPIKIRGHKGRIINTVGRLSVYCNLNKNLRGINMSRFVEVIHKAISNNISSDIVKDILTAIKTRLESDDAYVKIRFMYFIKKKAPISKKIGFINIPCVFEGRLINGQKKIYLTVEAPYISLCPCSKEISKASAHNQRSTATITVEMKTTIKIEKLIDIVDNVASSPIYSILKRPDEKFVTEQAYSKPMFVEDVARDISLLLDKFLDKQISDYVVVIEHQESIHNHNALAIINAGRNLK